MNAEHTKRKLGGILSADAVGHPKEFFARQINSISHELAVEQGFSRNLKNTLDLFRRYVALCKRKAGNVRQQEIQSDLIVP
jgi:hypothetical protein